MALLSAGDHVIAMDDLYGGTGRLFRSITARQGIAIDFVDASDASKVAAAIKPNTRMVWIESPTNPLLKLCDIAAVAAVLSSARSKILLVVDNTFMSPYFQRPLNLGADISFSSCTKYINGHSDVVMGMCVVR